MQLSTKDHQNHATAIKFNVFEISRPSKPCNSRQKTLKTMQQSANSMFWKLQDLENQATVSKYKDFEGSRP